MAGLYDRPDLYDPVAGDNPAALGFYACLAGADPALVLDIGCGSGRLALPLAARGHLVTGVDASSTMLEEARRQAQAQGMQMTFVDADFRELNLSFKDFAFAFSATNTLLHLKADDDLLSCLRAVARHLRNGGRFAFDMFVPNPQILARSPGLPLPIATFQHAELGPIQVEEDTRYDAPTQMLAAAWTWRGSNGRVLHRAEFALRQRFPDEAMALVSISPFCIVDRFGDFAGSAFTPDSQRQVYLLTTD